MQAYKKTYWRNFFLLLQTIKNAKRWIETVTFQAATTSSDVGDDYVEITQSQMEWEEVSSELQELNSADTLVENTAVDDADCFTEFDGMFQQPQSADRVAIPECANYMRLSKRNIQLSNQLITAQTKLKKSAKERKALKK